MVSGRASAWCVAGGAALAGVAGWGHVGYPVWLAWRTRQLPDRRPPTPAHDAWPGLSVVLPAYREAGVIATTCAAFLADAYPGPLEVIVVADDEETAEAAAAAGVRVLTSAERRGKADAVNRGVAACRHDVVVLADANVVIAPGSLRALAVWMADPAVGAVAGSKRVAGTQGQGMYWRFEDWLKRREARTGATIGLVGELSAVRRSCIRPLPTDLAAEDLWLALDVVEQGLGLAYEPRAATEEAASDDLRLEWERRTMIVAGVLDVLWRRRSMLLPGATPVTDQLWGHRLVRSSAGPIAHLVLLITAAAAVRTRLGGAVVAAHVGGAVAFARAANGRATTPERLVAQILFLQAVGLAGTIRLLRRQRTSLWPKQAR